MSESVPQVPESEAAIVSVLMEPGAVARLLPAVRELLPDASFFHDPAHAEIYRSELALADRGLQSDRAGVLQDLRSRSVLERIGGPEHVLLDFHATDDLATVREHASAIREAYRKRELLRGAIETARSARNGVPASEIIATVKKHVEAIEAVRPVGALDSWREIAHAEIHGGGVKPTTWDVEQLLERDSGPAILFGEPGTYKSWIALHFSVRMVTGEPAFGHFKTTTRPGSAYVNLDGGAKPFNRRAAMVERPIDGLKIVSPDEFDPERFRALVKCNPGAFVVVDTFADMYVPDPQAEQGAEMRGFLRSLRRLYEENGCSGLLLDHTNRSNMATAERYYGSVQKKGAIRQMICVERVRMPEERHGRARVKLTCAKMSEAEQFEPFLLDLWWTESTYGIEYAGPAGEAIERASRAATDADMVAAVLAKGDVVGLKRSEIEELTGLTRARVTAAIKAGGFDAIGAPNAASRRYTLRTPLVSIDFETDEADE